ncbi:MAG: type II secretory pathway predicted ATPase ExeA [Desulforhopalus sp.]|jgi:type II secretory pathway predicted ATPase ExeA
MYLEFFKLSRKTFSCDPDPDFFSKRHSRERSMTELSMSYDSRSHMYYLQVSSELGKQPS